MSIGICLKDELTEDEIADYLEGRMTDEQAIALAYLRKTKRDSLRDIKIGVVLLLVILAGAGILWMFS